MIVWQKCRGAEGHVWVMRVTAEQGEENERVAREQKEGNDWVTAQQREGSKWVTRKQGEESKRLKSVIEMFQYETKYLPIM
jgi:hypothetical protein